ncbi:hypothetical protein [Photobacterium leiognathi]|uniref:hypothetical protein n=1 Tax=Photobacterium leiognathi TaxID=553611 RepID=UPI0029813F64|nr:hypothetical protein [Photobacterium leiognathi]
MDDNSFNQIQKTYNFTLNIDYTINNDDDLLSVSTALYAGACYDAVIGSIDHNLYAEFHRVADSKEAAIKQAIDDVQRLEAFNLKVISVKAH